MKYIKRFENEENSFRVGDLVYFKNNGKHNNPNIGKYYEYVEKTIGEVISIGDYNITMVYENVPVDIKNFFTHHFDGRNRFYATTNFNSVRLATPEESERFRLKRNINKDKL